MVKKFSTMKTISIKMMMMTMRKEMISNIKMKIDKMKKHLMMMKLAITKFKANKAINKTGKQMKEYEGDVIEGVTVVIIIITTMMKKMKCKLKLKSMCKAKMATVKTNFRMKTTVKISSSNNTIM